MSTKILRQFFKIVEDLTLNHQSSINFKLTKSFDYCEIIYEYSQWDFDLGDTKVHHQTVFCYTYDGYLKLFDPNIYSKSITIKIDPEDFKNEDEIFIVLKYGRNILDDFIISLCDVNNISIINFKEYLSL